MQYLNEAFYVFVTLIALINPISAAAVFAALTEGRSDKDQAEIARRATIVAGVTLIAFAFVGEALLNVLGVKIGAFKIAGGLLLLKVGFNMVFAPAAHRQMADSRAAQCRPRKRSVGLSAGDPDHHRPRRAYGERSPGESDQRSQLQQRRDFRHRRVARDRHQLSLYARRGEAHELEFGQTGIDAVSRIIGIIIAAIAVELVVDGVTSLTHLVMS